MSEHKNAMDGLAGQETRNGKETNLILEAMARSRLTGRQFQILSLILRQTHGYRRNRDEMSPEFLKAHIPIPWAEIRRTLSQLSKLQIISANNHNGYLLNMPEFWDASVFGARARKGGPAVVKSPQSCGEITAEPCRNQHKIASHLKVTTKGNSKDKGDKSPADSKSARGGQPSKIKPFQQEAGAFLDWVRSREKVKLVNRGKLMGLVRSTLVATEATADELMEWYESVKQTDPFWGAREPPVIIGKMPEKFPTWLRDKREGRLSERRARSGLPKFGRGAGPKQLPSAEELEASVGKPLA